MKRSVIAGVALLLVACGRSTQQEAQTAQDDVVIDSASLAAFQPLPSSLEADANAVTAQKVSLGRMLYYDTRFSTTGDISCYVCHPLHDYGTTHRATGVGHHAQVGGRNEPTVYNAAGQIAQFWDGRAADVEAQALGPVTNPIEMGMSNSAAVMRVVKNIPGYVDAFKNAFPNDSDPVTFENFGRAIGAFERGLITHSAWDDFLEKKPDALTRDQKEGFRTFSKVGCATCHNGAYVGGNSYQKAGLVNAWYSTKDEGRSKVTKNPADRMFFKVPSLRNVQQTWPYFHDGSVQRLDDAVRLMGWHQLGRNLTDDEVRSIVTWLRSLTGQVPFDYIDEPILPPSPAQKTT